MKEQEKIQNIKTHGVYHDHGENRNRILFEEIGVPADQKADYVLLSGCYQSEGLPQERENLKVKLLPEIAWEALNAGML